MCFTSVMHTSNLLYIHSDFTDNVLQHLIEGQSSPWKQTSITGPFLTNIVNNKITLYGSLSIFFN